MRFNRSLANEVQLEVQLEGPTGPGAVAWGLLSGLRWAQAHHGSQGQSLAETMLFKAMARAIQIAGYFKKSQVI